MSELYEQTIGINFEAKNGISKPVEDAEKSLTDFTAVAMRTAKELSALFSKDQITRAQNLANTVRAFNGSWESNVAEGFKRIKAVNDADDLGDAFSKMTAAQVSAIKGLYETPEKELHDFSVTAINAADSMSKLFSKEEVTQAKELAKAMRGFNEAWEGDTLGGLSGIAGAKDVKELAEAFSKLTSGQANIVSGLFKGPEKVNKDFSGSARTMASYLSNTFTKDEFKKASEMAASIRQFKEGWEQDTDKGLSMLKGVQNIDKLAEALSNLSSSQVSTLGKLIEEPENALTPLQTRLEKVAQKAQKSLKGFKSSLDHIGNIIRYRIIRGGISRLVQEMNEGTKSVYIFARAFRQMDQNNIAATLDKYATLTDAIRGNLGAAWATTLSALSDVLTPFLDKLSEAISKVTAFASAMNGSTTYMKVATDNVKRYYDTVANGLQDIKVIGNHTKYEEALIPENVSKFAENIRNNLSGVGELTSGVAAGLAILLIGTGHVVAGLEVGAAALGIKNLTNQVDENNTKSKIEQAFQDIGGILPAIELGLGLVFAANGKFQWGIPLILRAASNSLEKLGDFNFEEDLKTKFKIADTTLNAISLGLGAVLCYFGEYKFGVPLLVGGLIGTAKSIEHNWDDIMGAFENLGQKIEIWWWALWNNLAGASWAEKVNAYYDAFPELRPKNTSGTPYNLNNLEGEGEELRGLINNSSQLELALKESSGTNALKEWTDERVDAMADAVDGFVGGIGEVAAKIGKVLVGLVYEGFDQRYNGLDRVNKYADGGFPSAGSLFIAGEVPGQTELVGTINGRTGVAGGAEITGIREAIYEVGAEILAGMAENRTVVNVEGNADGIFNMVRAKSADYTRRTGEFAF